MLEGFKYVFCLETCAIPLFLYCFSKLLLPIQSDDSFAKIIIYRCLRPAIVLLLITPTLVCLFLCAVYFGIINTFAKLKFGKQYMCYFDGADAIWSIEGKQGKGVIHTIFYIEDNGPQTPEVMLQCLRADNVRTIKLHARFCCLRKYFMGYFFFVKTDIDTRQFIDYLDDYNTTDEYHKEVARKIGSPLPMDNEFLWEACLGKKPVEFETGKYGYPFLVRYHHSALDGISLTVFLMTSFVKDGYNIMKNSYDDLKKILTKNNKAQNEISWCRMDVYEMLKRLKYFLRKDYYFHYNMLNGDDKPHSLHRTPGTEKILKTTVAKQDDRTIEKIKAIKNKLANVSFNDVVLGAIAASFTEHFVKYDPDAHPKSILTANPYFLKALDFNELITFNKDNVPITNVGNKFTVGYIHLPINGDYLKDPKQFVYALHKETESLKNSMDFQVTYWILNIISTIVPRVVPRKLLEFYDPTVIVSNLPGVCNIVYHNGYKILDSVYTSHHYMNTGNTFTIYSFENCMRIATYVDKNNICEEEKVKMLGDNVFKYINKLYESVVLKV